MIWTGLNIHLTGVAKMALKGKNTVARMSFVTFALYPLPSLPGQATYFPGLLRQEASFSCGVLRLRTSFLLSGQVFAFCKERGGYRHNKSIRHSNVSWVWRIIETPFWVTALSSINIFWMFSLFHHNLMLGKFFAPLGGWPYLSFSLPEQVQLWKMIDPGHYD